MSSIQSHIIITPRELRLRNAEGEFTVERAIDDKNFLKSLYKELNIGYTKFYKMDGLSRLGFLGAEYLLRQETIDKENCDLLFINKHASLAVDAAYQDSLSTLASPALFVYTLSNIVQGEICIRHKIYGENYTFVENEFTPEALYSKAETLIQSSTGGSVLISCMDYLDDEHYELLMLHIVKKEDNQSIKFNLQELSNIFEALYK